MPGRREAHGGRQGDGRVRGGPVRRGEALCSQAEVPQDALCQVATSLLDIGAPTSREVMRYGVDVESHRSSASLSGCISFRGWGRCSVLDIPFQLRLPRTALLLISLVPRTGAASRAPAAALERGPELLDDGLRQVRRVDGGPVPGRLGPAPGLHGRALLLLALAVGRRTWLKLLKSPSEVVPDAHCGVPLSLFLRRLPAPTEVVGNVVEHEGHNRAKLKRRVILQLLIEAPRQDPLVRREGSTTLHILLQQRHRVRCLLGLVRVLRRLSRRIAAGGRRLGAGGSGARRGLTAEIGHDCRVTASEWGADVGHGRW
mmetsp:Transcript_54783/g.138823  ORF Transcript_54783/g.138823 Transcript_54783/m.138823 type:complete len:315 (-) Transcript_54783:16-960(-)